MCEDICPEIFEMPDVAKVIQGAISGKTKPGIAVQTEHI